MADLDDFFAKKDRKKSKSTKKFSTTDEVAKKLEDNAKKTEKQKKERVIPEGEESSMPAHDQDEWKDFEEEKKDYSGLKIGNLTITSQNDGNTGTTEQNVEQQQGADEGGSDNDKKVGPWKRVDVEVVGVLEEPVKVEKKVEIPTPSSKIVQGGAYVPPSMRNQSQQPQVQPSRMRSKAAPDIHNEEFFPTLSKTSDFKKNRSEGSFEVVQHTRAGSHRQVEQAKVSSGQGPKLSLENRFNTLSDS